MATVAGREFYTFGAPATEAVVLQGTRIRRGIVECRVENIDQESGKNAVVTLQSSEDGTTWTNVGSPVTVVPMGAAVIAAGLSEPFFRVKASGGCEARTIFSGPGLIEIKQLGLQLA